MDFYGYLKFVKHPVYKTQFVLAEQKGEIKGLKLSEYKDTDENKRIGISGFKYISMEVPKSPAMRKFFSHTFTMADKKVLTSCEALNSQNRTFGDTKCLGSADLILIQLSEDRTWLEMWFVKDKGNSKQEKQEIFRRWCNA